MKMMLFFLAAAFCFAQEPVQTQTKYYRFDFVVKDVDAGRVQNAKTYSVIGRAMGRESIVIRAGEKVPVGTPSNQTYVDVGVNIDCRILSESPTEIGLSVSADISSADSRIPPVISQTKWNSNVVVPLKKPTVIFSSENPSKKVQTQLEVTVTPLQ
jgi:hypothetical protein